MIDLHTHSTESDGDYSPEDVVDLAKDAGLSVLAVSDHDTIEGSVRAMKRGKDIDIEVISAVEISASLHGKVLHILGYYIDLHNEHLRRTLEEARTYRTQRAETMVKQINEELLAEGMKPMDIEVLLKIGQERPITRPDLAEYLIELGNAATREEAFQRWLIKYNIPHKGLSAAEAISIIHQAGGVAVLAHPLSKDLGLQAVGEDVIKEQDELLAELVRDGLDGVEAYRPKTTYEDQDRYVKLAAQLGIIATGGTDYHGPRHIGGPAKPGAVVVPDEVAAALKERSKAYSS